MDEVLLQLDNIKKTFGSRRVLDGVSLEVRAGEIYGIAGRSGSGKTTLAQIAAGLCTPDSGTVRIGALTLWPAGRADLRHQCLRQIGYVPDTFGAYENLRVLEYMEFFADIYGITGLDGRRRCEMLLDQTGLGDRLDYDVGTLSPGMQQRLGLARALIHDPQILILDEQSAGADPVARGEILAMLQEIRDQGKAVLSSFHLLSELSSAGTRVGMLDEGRVVVSGTMEEILDKVQLSMPIHIQTSGNPGALIAFLRERKDIQSMTVQGSDVRVEFHGDKEAETWLLGEMMAKGLPICGFMREKADPEDIFSRISENRGERVVVDSALESGAAEGDSH